MTTFKEFEEEAWERKAHLFDDTWGRVTSQPNQRILEILSLSVGESLLDVGCGAGRFSGLAYEHGVDVTGSDYSKAMVEIASKNYPAVRFQQEDAEHLSFNDETFDAAALNYLLLHVPDQKKVILETKRVLKKGGRLVYTLWLPATESPALSLILGAIGKYADISVIPPADDIFQFVSEEFSKRFFSENGFVDYTRETYPNYFETKDKEGFFSGVLAGTRMGGTIELQRPEVKEQIKNEIFSRITEFKTADGYKIPIPSVITSAKKQC